jgi:Family of unknown function (DUF5677)
MDDDKYKKIISSFDRLNSYAIEISFDLTGMITEEDRLIYADTIFTKLVSHALSLRKISPSLNSGTTELWDVSSACAISRALIESYEALAYISINDITSIEREFRIKLWHLHDQQRRFKMLTQIESMNPEVLNVKKSAEKLHLEITNHALFSSCSKEVIKKINGRDAPAFYLNQKDRNLISGINHAYHNTVTMALSQYVHTLPMAIHQLMGFRAGNPESLHAYSMSIRYSMAFLAKAISGMTEIFPRKVSEPSSETASDMEFWLNVAKNGVSNIESE